MTRLHKVSGGEGATRAIDMASQSKGAAAIATSPLPSRSGVATLAVPAPAQWAGDDGSMFELPESRQRLLGTEQYVFLLQSTNVAGLRQLKLCSVSVFT